MTYPEQGLPGIQPTKTASHRQVVLADPKWLPGGVVISGEDSRDADHSPVDELRAGLMLGKVSASSKYAPSVVGLLAALHDTSVALTTLTVPTSTAIELNRRVGATGSLKLIGPATAAGSVNVETVAYSAINTTNGEITIDSATTNDFEAGSIIAPADGSENPLVIMPDGFGLKVTDIDDQDRDVPLARPLIGGVVDVSKLVSYSSDPSVKQWQKDQLNQHGQFIFNDDF